MTDSPPCPLCDQPPEFVGQVERRDAYACGCERCGKFIFTDEATFLLNSEPTRSNRYLLSAMTRRASDRKKRLELLTSTIPALLEGASKPSTPHDVIEPLLLAIHARTADVGSAAAIAFRDYPLFVLRSDTQLDQFLKLLHELGLVDVKVDPQGNQFICRLTLKGWDRITELRRSGRSSIQAFVAMSFAPELDSAWIDGFEPALKEAGWNPLRMDRLQHNERIDDKIIAEIRRSGLLIADFTGNRAGVYFEAGLAQGLGIPVIWTVQREDLPSVHFDTRQYNHIDWIDPSNLRLRLYDRLMATVSAPGS